ncbi:MAG: class I SAM-dependent methyltransferase [Chthoniobacterales bacterium]|nr:class I SAM-dependent methyltransferase [Chthoniobacterales bacterium]
METRPDRAPKYFAMTERSRWQGMTTIARFNWPLYLIAAGVAVVSLGALCFALGMIARVAALLALAAAGYFLGVSLAVSHQVYDRSDLYRWNWLAKALRDTAPGPMIFCHAGFDETSPALRSRVPATEWLVLDHFEPERMTEPSIRRARRRFPPLPGTRPAPFGRWPVESSSAAIVWGLLAIHELRSEGERTAWFREAARCLQPGGCVILAEHTRDWPNFLAFGPGFLHFHSPASWRRCWETAGLRLREQIWPTWWVGVFVLVKP